MELRDSGRDLVQIKDDGTHAILPVTRRADVQPDHARVPVMLLRHSDGKMRRDGSNAASMQPNTAVAERGRLHGAPGLAVVEEPRVLARIRGPFRNQERNGQWVRERRLVDRLRRQDKANSRSRTRRPSAVEKPLSAHWFLEARRLAFGDIRSSLDGAFRASRRISAR
jgi:hypothetical protein